MRFTIVLTLAILLSGCGKTTSVSEDMANNAINAADALEATLTGQCKTESVLTQLTVIKTQIRGITNACELEKDLITKEKLRWQWSFWGLLAVIVAYLIKKVLK